jgi:hypothetical protein
MASRQHARQKRTEAQGNQNGLILDDYLGAITDVRNRFKLAAPTFRLRQVESYPSAKEAVETIVDLVIRRHGTSISTKPHALLADFGDKIYSDSVITPVYSRCRIHPEHRNDVLRRTIEIGLQTITQLPSAYPVAPAPRRRLKSLAGAFAKAADLANKVMDREEVRKRIELYFENEDDSRRRLLRGIDELRWCTQILEGISRLRVRKLSIDSRNPRVSMALYVVNWFQACTGSKQYGDLAILLEGAFDAAKLSTPRWVDRLSIEMHARRRRREKWMARISSR